MFRYPDLGPAFDAIHDNLTELDTRQAHLLECRMAHLEEWADTVLRTAGEERDMLLRLLDLLCPDREIEPQADVPAENREALCEALHCLALPHRLFVLRSVLGRGRSDLLSEAEDAVQTDEVSEHAADKIAYVQNTFSDTAYLCFSALLTRPRAAYFDSFSDICEEVYNGICEYCILPILHDRDGKLFRFYELLEKYDLRIVSACDVPRTAKDGVSTTRYALIRKSLSLSRKAEDGEMPTYLELRLPADSTVSLPELLHAAQLCRMSPERVDTRADIEQPELLCHHITLRLSDADLGTFLAFLTLDVPRSTVVGLYRVRPLS